MYNEEKIERAINKVLEIYPQAIIFGALLFPESIDNPEEIIVYGNCSDEAWQGSLNEYGMKGINYFQIETVRVKDLIPKTIIDFFQKKST